MSRLHQRLFVTLSLATIILATSTAEARLFGARARASEELVPPLTGPVLAAPTAGSPIVTSPVIAASPVFTSCYQPCITYKDHVHRRSCFACQPKIDMVLAVQGPCGCGLAEIPVCVPVCCVDVPCVDRRHGLFKREIVNYEWKCGFRIKIVFNRHGDAVVHYLG